MREITAPREFSPFEEICTLTPFIERLSREYKDVACESCFERKANLKSCKACLEAKYCGKDCQKKDWKNHKLECQKLKNLPLDQEIKEADATRLHGNIILKIKGKDWKTIKGNVLGMDISFDDIDTSVSSVHPYDRIYYRFRKENVRRYIGDENMPNDEDFMEILRKVQHSRYQTSISKLGVKIVRVLFEPLLFETRCIPNCYMIPRKGRPIIKAIKKIEKSEKLSLSEKQLFEIADFPGISPVCNCTDCRLPYGESVLSKIIDERKALEVIIRTQQFISMWDLFEELLRMPAAEFLVDDLLGKHEGVLGDTNALHLKLLAIKCFKFESDPLEKMRYLLKLEKNIKAVFGEHHPYLGRVYSALSESHFFLGNFGVQFQYLEKEMYLGKMFS